MRILPNIVVSALLFLGSSAWADNNSSIKGTVTGLDGKRLANVEVRAERLHVKAAPALTKTDAKGQYVFKTLPAGTYTITAIVKAISKSRATVDARSGGLARVDLDLRTSATGRKIAGKPATPANTPATDNLSRAQGRLGGNINGMSFPGH
jgi:hypothetical protein